MGSSILELIERDKQVLVAHVPHSVRLGITVLDVKPNECWMKVPYDESLIGNIETRIVAGGVITTLLDQACGSSVMVSLDELMSIATLTAGEAAAACI